MLKTKVRVMGEPGLCEKVAAVVQEHFVIEGRPEKHEGLVGPKADRADALGITVYITVREPVEPESGYSVTCPLCGKVYQDWNGLQTKEQVENSFRAHLSGKHCVRGDVFKKAYESAKRKETIVSCSM